MVSEAKAALMRWLGRIDAMERADPMRGKEVREHEIRVARLCARFASSLGFDDRGVSRAFLAGRYHDIGKYETPLEILLKRGPLDARERMILVQHTSRGAEMLASSDVEPPAFMVETNLYHHERWDGRGYHGLSGDEIPFHARLVSLCDVFDALVSPRAYKAGMSEADALVLMSSNDPRCGRDCFDPGLLPAFVGIHLAEGAMDIPRDQRAGLARFVADASSVPVPSLDVGDPWRPGRATLELSAARVGRMG